ncbi:unnamed protein product, partial [Clonostachys rhizophaga]
QPHLNHITMSSSILTNDLFSVKGLVAFVTGGGSGIGLLIAQALEANGATVYIYGRRKEVLEKAARTAKHGNIHVIQGDVTSKPDLQRAAQEIKTAHGYVNLVIANAGIGGPSIKTLKPNASLEEFENHLWGWTAEEFTETFAANTTGAFNTVAAFLQLLGEGNKRGNVTQKSQVIATSSIGAFNRSLTQGYAYGGSKAAVVHIFKQLATSLVPYDIRSNIIAPGFYPSEMTATVIAEREKQGWPKSIIPEQRAGDAQDIAGAVLFLVSRAGAYINGNVLITDGGRLSVVPATY